MKRLLQVGIIATACMATASVTLDWGAVVTVAFMLIFILDCIAYSFVERRSNDHIRPL